MQVRRSWLWVGIGAVLILAGVLLLAWTAIGHQYRYPIEEQTATWHDGQEQYHFERSDQDTFDLILYENTRSVADAVQYIREHYQPETEEEELKAAYEFTRKRFMHYMYPHHTWLTNPYLAFAEWLFPGKPYNTMALADDTLRHSAVASCTHAANVFVEIHRAMGGEAQMVNFSGHTIAEARIGSQRYFVDADLERFLRGDISEVTKSESGLRTLYAGYPKERIYHFLEVFWTEATFFGYGGPPFDSPRIYRMQLWISRLKWAVPTVLILAGGFLLSRGRYRAR